MSDTLPPGFTLDQSAAAQLPPGFTVDRQPGPSSPQPQVDDYGRPVPEVSLSPQGAAVPAPIARIGAAAADAWRNTPEVFTPQMQAVMDQGPLGQQLWNPMAKVAGGVMGGINALGAGLSAVVGETATAAGAPNLGRDLNIAGQVVPIVMAGAPGMPMRLPEAARREVAIRESAVPVREPLAAVAERATDRIAAPLPDEFRDQPFAPSPPSAATEVPTMTVRPGMGAPEQVQPGMGAAQPTEAAGAQVSTAAEAEMTPQQVAAYQATAEGNKLLEAQQPGFRDDRELIPGVAANHAEIEQTVQTARELKNAGQKVPEVGQEMQEIADANNLKRVGYHENTIGSKVDIHNAKLQRDAQGEADRAAAFANAGEADAQPVLDKAAEIVRSKEGRRPAVRKALDSVTRELAVDDQGNLYTDPEQLYGVRMHIGDLLSKEGAATDPLSMRAKSALLQLQDTLDQAIEGAAPGFRRYLDNFAAASRRINEMEVLQDHYHGLFAANNRMGYAKFQKMMRDIVDSRMNPDPISPYKSITEDTMQRLWRLRDDLRRSASAKELASAAGSDSAQNIWTAARSAAGGLPGTAAAAVVGHAVAGPVGGAAAGFSKTLVENAMSARTLRRERARGMEMLRGQTRPMEPAPIGRWNPLSPP